MPRMVLSVSLPPNLGRMVQEEAEARGVPMSVVIREALLLYFSEKRLAKKEEAKGNPEGDDIEGFPTRGDPQITEIGTRITNKGNAGAENDLVFLKQFDSEWLLGLYRKTSDPKLKERVEVVLRDRGVPLK